MDMVNSEGSELLKKLDHNNNSSRGDSSDYVLAMNELAEDFSGMGVHESLFKEISLSRFSGRYLLMLFYPLDFNTIFPSILEEVPQQALDFSRRMDAFRRMDCEVMAISTDSLYVHLAYSLMDVADGGIGEQTMHLLADVDCEISRKYGMLNEDESIAYNGVVLINRDGKVKHMAMSDFPIGIDADEVLRVVAALKAVEEADYTICTPEAWKPSDPVVKI